MRHAPHAPRTGLTERLPGEAPPRLGWRTAALVVVLVVVLGLWVGV